ncbi:MAG: EutN/CcmL family microcompartment protein [Opitutales bacterium]
MQLARVDGNITATICHPSMRGWRTLICQPIAEDGSDAGQPMLAIDPHGAGLHARVIVSTDGMATRGRVEDVHSPLRNMVIGLAD